MRKQYNRSSGKGGKYYFINNRIQADQLRTIDAGGEQIGVMTRDEALAEAQAQGLDLVLIAPNAQPPVAKIIDFKKFLYLEEKKRKEAKKGSKKSDTKDIKLSLFIGEADLERLLNKAKEFLDEGHQVRLNLTLKGREMMKKQMAMELMQSWIAKLGDINISKEPRFEGRVVRAVISKKK